VTNPRPVQRGGLGVVSDDDRKANVSAPCKVFRHTFDGAVYRERILDHIRWVGRFECTECGTHRIDIMTEVTCELISRRYFYPQDYATGMDRTEAKQWLFKQWLANPDEDLSATYEDAQED